MDGKTLVSGKDKTLGGGDLESRRLNGKILVTGKAYYPAYYGGVGWRGRRWEGTRGRIAMRSSG